MTSFADRARMPAGSRADGARPRLLSPAAHAPRPPWVPIRRIGRTASAEQTGLAPAPNRTGLPEALKAGIEALSGLAMDEVRVHRDSTEPAKLGALAYTQGNDIHLGPAQERHLAHEAWHVVQQRRGRVAATAQLKGVSINDDSGLEAEADRMASRVGSTLPAPPGGPAPAGRHPPGLNPKGPIQRRKMAPAAVPQCSKPDELDEVAGVGAPTPLWRYEIVDQADHDGRSAMLNRLTEIYSTVGKGLSKWAYLSESGVQTQCTVLLKRREDRKKATGEILTFNLDEEEWERIEAAADGQIELAEFRDKEYIKTGIDPLAVEISSFYAPYKGAHFSAALMTIIVQFSEEHPGYIINVEDSGMDVNYSMENRAQLNEGNKKAKERKGTFSNKHHAGPLPVEDYVNQVKPDSSEFESERAVDAITKVIAEGGRFEAVRKMGTKISDNTIFYVRKEGSDSGSKGKNDNEDVKVSKVVYQGITFHDLWLSWGETFKKEYNISIDALRKKVASGSIKLSHHVHSGEGVKTYDKLPDNANHFDLGK